VPILGEWRRLGTKSGLSEKCDTDGLKIAIEWILSYSNTVPLRRLRHPLRFRRARLSQVRCELRLGRS
jgi:hypothetical protein